MERRQFLAGSLAARIAPGLARAQSAELRPNVLLIIFDKCRTDAIGAYEERNVYTPNIDALAQSGVRFANCYTPQALCGPARASIFTGSYPHAHGLRRNVYPFEPRGTNATYREFLPDPFRDPRFRLWDNFPFLLNSAGYSTAYIGKWHLGPANPGFFDYWKGFNSTLRHWVGEPHRSLYRPDLHTDQAVRFIERQGNEPFLLCQSYYAPHEPLDPPKQFLERYKGQEHAGYYGSATNLDWNVGRIVEALKRRKILDDTLILLTTEHGRTWGQRPGTLEGMCIAYEEASRIPLIIRYPKLFPGGTVWRSGVSLVDLMPTILEATNIQMPPGTSSSIQGRSLIANNDQWNRPIVLQNIPQVAIDGSYYDERALRNERYKLILRKFEQRPELRPGELYDLQQDPTESRNLYASESHRETVRQMARSLQAWGKERRDPLSVELGTWAADSTNSATR